MEKIIWTDKFGLEGLDVKETEDRFVIDTNNYFWTNIVLRKYFINIVGCSILCCIYWETTS